MSILVLAEHNNTAVKSSTLSTISAASKLGNEIEVLVVGSNIENIIKEKNIESVFLVHHETSSCVLNDVAALNNVCIRHNVDIILDAVSTIAVTEIDLEKDVDGTIRPKGGFVREEFNADQNVRLKQGYLETSNVSMFDELVNNAEIQKHYQLNVKLISLAKEMDEASTSLMRLPNN